MSGLPVSASQHPQDLIARIERLQTQVSEIRGWVVLLAGLDVVVVGILFVLLAR